MYKYKYFTHFFDNLMTKITLEKVIVITLVVISLFFTVGVSDKISVFGLVFVLLMLPVVIKDTKTFLVILVSLKMVINSLYEINVVGDINILQIIGAFMPVYLMLYMLIKRIDLREYPYYMLILVFVIEILFSIIITFYGSGNINGFIKLLRILNGITCFFAFPLIFKSKNDIVLFIKAWMIGTSFPLIIGAYQLITGQLHFQIQIDLFRIAGLYHDVGTIAFSGIIFVICTLYFFRDKQSHSKTYFLTILLAIVSYLIYRTYSKAAAITLGIILILYAFYSRKYLFTIFSAIAIILIFFTETSGVYKRIERDITIREKFGDRLMFTGRVGIWQRNINRYQEYRPLQKLVGQSTVGSAHNDFLRMLLDHGILGFLLYASLLVAVLLKLFKEYRLSTEREGKNLLFIALLTFISYILTCFSTTPSLYTDYQWFHWGLVGIALVHGRTLYKSGNEATL